MEPKNKSAMEQGQRSLRLLLLLLAIPSAAFATTCPKPRPLKSIRRISGVVYFAGGDRVASAKVTLLQAGKEVAVQETNHDGKFAFDELKAGKYEIRVQVKNVPDATAEVVLVRPTRNSSREIAVEMLLQGCSNFSLLPSKQLESRLNPE